MYDELDISLVRAQVEDWKYVREQYFTSFALGVRAVETKDARCGLCPRYLRYTVARVGNEWAELLTCRHCPIVRATGRTCAHMRASVGFGVDWFYHEHHAHFGVSRLIKNLSKIVKHMDAHNKQNAGVACHG